MGGPQTLNRKGARKHGRPSSTMKPEQFAQGERVRPFKPLNLRVSVDKLEDVDNPASPQTVTTAKHIMVDSKTAKPRHFSSSFLQPEQFLAELRVCAGAANLDVNSSEPASKPASSKPASPHLKSLPEPNISHEGTEHVSHETQVVEESEVKEGSGKDFESFYEAAHSVPTLELCFEGKPAPAPAHLRTKTSPCPPTLLPEKLNNTIVSESAQPASDKNSEEPSGSCAGVDSPHSPKLQKSSSHGSGRFFKAGSPSLHKMREKLVRSLSGKKENSEGGDAGIRGSTIEGHGIKHTGRLRRMLHWGASMEFLKLGKKSAKNAGVDSGDRAEQQRVDASQSEQEVSGCGESAADQEIFDEECCSPRSSASSVSTTYSEVSSKSHSYKQSHKKSHRSEVVKSKLRMLRVHQTVQAGATRESEDEDDGIFEALRQGAMFHGDTAAPKEEDGKLLNGSEKNSISKLVAKHKRNSTWDAGKLSLTDHIFSPKQPRLPTRDAHVLLVPPKRLTGDTRDPDSHARKGKQSPAHQAADETKQISPAVTPTATHQGTQVLHPPSAHESSRDATSPGSASQNHQTVSPGRAELPTPPASPGGFVASQRSSFRAFPGFTSPLPLPVSAETQTTPASPGLSATSSGSVSKAASGAGFQKEPIQPREPSISPDKQKPGGGNALPLPASSRPQGQSFEQIVAGRGRSPPTDNTLMKFFFKCREIEHLNKFLALQKRRFLDSSNTDEKCFHMILSEAGAGLSSMVSTLCTAWLLENTMASVTSAKWHPIPVMNISQKDMWQHRDAAWLFHVCGIDANAVLFLDEITPTNETVISGRVKRAVIGQDILVTKDEVASSCTIVSEKFRQEAPKLLQARYMMTLLLAGILVDTHNLSSGSSRDKQQATILLVGAGSLGRNGFYNQLMNVRDEDYVTSFIKEIYGDSNALTGDKPAQLAPGIEQSKALQTDKMPASLAASTGSSEVTAPISPPPLPSEKPIAKPSHKYESEAKSYADTKQSPSKKDSQPQNSKLSLALRLLRNRSSVQ